MSQDGFLLQADRSGMTNWLQGDYVLEIIDQYRLVDCPEELVFNIGNETLLAAIPSAEGVTCFGELTAP
jgi:hypothetical protein